ncbi:O-antigen biosynthesis protein, partial [hydrothermal vent metagenome]
EAHRLQEHDIQQYTLRMTSGWSLQPAIHLLVTHVSGQEEALADTLDSLGSQLYSGWGLSVISNSSCLDPVFEEMEMLEWCQVEGDLMRGVNAIAEASGADWLGLLEAGCIFEPHMLYQHIEHLHQHPEWRLVYMDEDRIDHNGERYEPRFKPECDLELLRATPYMGTFVLVERQALLAAGAYGLQAGVESSDTIFRVIDQNGEQAVGHIADVLMHRQDRFELALDQDLIDTNRLASVTAHLNRCGIEGEVKAGTLPGSCFVDYACRDRHPVEIIVPVTGKPETLELFLDSLLSKTQYPDFRVRLLVGDAVEIPAAVYNRDHVDVVSSASGARWQEVLELACNSDSEYLMLMSPGAIAIQPNWLERLVAHFQKPDVAVVAPRLISSDKMVVGGGIITGAGLHSIGVGAFDGLSLEDAGYMGRAQVMQAFSAVPACCILVRKSVLTTVKDSLASFRLAFPQSVDFCLRVRETGGKIIWTPHSTLMFIGEYQPELEGVSDLKTVVADESETICRHSLAELASDPAYNPNLRLNGEQFSVDDSFTPSLSSHEHSLSRIIGFGVGSYGSWQYRVVQPLDALQMNGKARCIMVPFSAHNKVPLPTLAELERVQPDALLMHNTLHDNYIEAIRQYKKVNDAFIVFGQDDLMSALPPSNPFSKTIYKDVKKRIRTCLSLADRLLVTTEPLAQGLRGMVDDIVVVPNYIDETIWGNLQSQRNVSAKPRVGWAGAQQHLGDLQLLEAVVRETASEVDWIFFGMCPESILPLVKEVHDPVLFEAYPEKLATLNLDLAVAPLERNKFNESKSNLRLLEYGILGWAVIASDVEPYQNAPVCRVTNQARAWINAIRERINDLNALHQEGDTLRHWVRENWILQNHANVWLDALKPSRKAGNRENVNKLAASL